MSNHFSADNLKFPGDDRRLDLTDVFAFTAPHDPDTTVLIIDSNPTSAPPPIPAPTTGPEFYPGAVYRINIDNDGDNLADVAFTFVFSEYQDGRQTGTAWYATGAEARQSGPVGQVLAADIPVSFDGMAQPVQVNGIRLAAGLRSDPFFADVEGALHGFAWTGHDDFAGNNVDSIALEVPSEMLGGPVIGVWASISRRRDDGTLEQLDRGGNPTINLVINPDGQKNLFNFRQPADDVANYLGPLSAILENAGGYSPEAARAAALQVLPDILHYDRTKPATYPNGRVPTDDVASLRYAWLTNGKVPRPASSRTTTCPPDSPTSARLTPDRSGWSPPRRRRWPQPAAGAEPIATRKQTRTRMVPDAYLYTAHGHPAEHQRRAVRGAVRL